MRTATHQYCYPNDKTEPFVICSSKLDSKPNTMKEVTIVAYSREFPIQISDQEPVLDIKKKIEDLLGIPVEEQALSVSGWELIDGLDMEDYPIVYQGTRIHLAIEPKLPPPHNFNLTIKLPSSRSFTIQVDTTDTVRSLREKISIVVLEGGPPPRMSLYYCGAELEDDFRNLSEYGIRGCGEVVVFFKNCRARARGPDGGAADAVLRLAVQTSSCLLNGATIPVEVKDSGSVGELGQLLMGSKILPEDDYIFIHRQRIMRENCSLRWHGVQDGDVLYVFKGTVSRGSH